MKLEKEFTKRNEMECFVLFRTLSDSDKERFFEFIIKTHPDFNVNKFLFELPPNLKLKFISYFDSGLFQLSQLLSGTDDITKYEMLKYLYIHEDNHFFSLAKFKFVPKQYREDFLKVMYETERDNGIQAISSYELDDYIKVFDYQDRVRIIKEIIVPNFKVCYTNVNGQDVFNGFAIISILKAFSDGENHELNAESMYDLIDFFIEYDEENKSNMAFHIVELYQLLKNEGLNIKDIFRHMFEKIGNKHMSLYRVSEVLPKEERKDFVYFVLDERGLKSFSYLDFITLIHTLTDEEMEEALVHYLIDDPTINYFKILGYTYCLDHFLILLRHIPISELMLNINDIVNELSQNERYLKYEDKYQPIVQFFANKFELDLENYTKFVQKFGFLTVKYLNMSAIKTYINLPHEQFERLLGLFTDNTLHFDNNNINDILNSILQRKFMYENPNIYNIFSFFEEHLSNKDYQRIELLLKEIGQEINIDAFLEKRGATFSDLMNQIYLGDTTLLHEVTDRYIAFKREQYAGTHLNESKHTLDVKRVLNRTKYKEKYINSYSSLIAKDCLELTDVTFTESQQHLLNDSDLMRRLTDFKQKPQTVQIAPEDKKYLKTLSELLDILYDHKVNLHNLSDFELEKYTDSDIELVQNQIENNYLLGILVETIPKVLLDVINNDELYQKLQSFLAKYKLLGWSSTFSELLTSCAITFDEGTLGSLITNFEKIVKKIEENCSLTAIVDYANCYSSTSRLYSLLFTDEDFRLISSNPRPNQATANRFERINKNIEMIPSMYKRSYVTTPTFDQTFDLSNGKQIEVILGNVTNMMNLTYGERTASCMRQCGAFNDLFHHCIEDKNGFHIRFTDPSNGKLISRVSGTRNGNTIFLNELRESLDTKAYSNEDLYETIKKVGEYLIQVSRNTFCPIENVVITQDYALSKLGIDEIDLCLDPEVKKEALRGISFNFKDKGILLASSNGESLAEYKFTEDVPNYSTIREPVREYRNIEARNRINQLHLINEVIKNGKSSLDAFVISEEIPDLVISGEDFYVAYYPDRYESFMLDISTYNKRTLDEMQSALDNIKGSVRK